MARHITELEIESFRGVKELKLKDLGDINIFVGDNNSGKTSVLEAIQILCDPSEFNIMQVARQRDKYKSTSSFGLSLFDLFLYLFNGLSDMKENNQYRMALSAVIHDEVLKAKVEGILVDVLIEGKQVSGNNAESGTIENHGLIEMQEEVKTFVGSIKTILPEFDQVSVFNGKEREENIEINRYTKQIRSSKDKSVIKVKSIQVIDHVVDNAFDELIKNRKIKEKTLTLLKDFEPGITDLRYINDDGRFVPVVESELPDYLPLSMYGDGMKKALTILNALVSAENGIVIIDEFETAIHTTAMENVFRFMITVAKELNVQLFLTTHSIEAVDKVLTSAGADVDNIRVITLKKDQKTGKTLSRNLIGSEVQQDRDAFDFEVRV
ncbi:ATP/GTP-binding protein [Acetobacterium sp.]|uniref:AAA family ATPase n=1 Tax=Acetobacterium sp. TaxID=1872094 RepID=UPI002721C2CF|nr:AAA family ATPase [Acetobacterium sp.]MDO9493338.1 AAA family ATPase [Acetobacterium sp.]